MSVTPDQPTPDEPTPDDQTSGPPGSEDGAPDVALRAAVREIERHVAEAGWDSPPRLYALADTVALLAAAPELAEQMGLDADAGGLTSVEQDLDPAVDFEQLLVGLDWPDAVVGAVAVVERLVLARPEGPEDVDAEAAAADPDAQEVRIVAGVLRPTTTTAATPGWCALRVRAHDHASAVIEGPDVVPGLVRLLAESFA